MSPINPRHSNAVRELLEWGILNAPLAQVSVQGQDPIGIPELDSVPQPDIVWIRRGDYRLKRPSAADVLLLVEVADSSLAQDRGRKSRIYAEAGIADYWIVNVPDQCIEVRRDPEVGTYRSQRTYRPGESIPIIVLPAIALPGGGPLPRGRWGRRLIPGATPMSTSVRITVEEYDRMIAEGRFEPPEEHHVELIDGEIRPMSPIGPAARRGRRAR